MEGIVFLRERCAVLRVTVMKARNVLLVDVHLGARLVEAVVPPEAPLAVPIARAMRNLVAINVCQKAWYAARLDTV